MVHSDPEAEDIIPAIKQVEFNTIASSFGGLSTKVSHLHSYGLLCFHFQCFPLQNQILACYLCLPIISRSCWNKPLSLKSQYRLPLSRPRNRTQRLRTIQDLSQATTLRPLYRPRYRKQYLRPTRPFLRPPISPPNPHLPPPLLPNLKPHNHFPRVPPCPHILSPSLHTKALRGISLLLTSRLLPL